MNNDSSQFDDIDQFLHTNINNKSPLANQPLHPQQPQYLQSAITQDQLLAQNARLLQQLHEQQRMLNLQNLLAQNMFPAVPEVQNKKIKKTHSTLNRITSTASLSNALPIQDIKGNVKNAYIKKITSLLSVEGDQLIDQELQEDLQSSSESIEEPKQNTYRLAGLLGSTNDLVSAETKNKRLRQSAKKSRLRKKIYLKLLEKKVSDLDSKIETYKKTTKQSFDYLTKVLASHHILNSMIIGNSQAMDQVISCQSNEQAQLVLDSYLMRYGSCGIKRRDYIKYGIKNIQRNFLKGNYGLQLISMNKDGKNGSNYDDEEFNNYVEILKKLAKLDDENLTYKVLPTIDKLLNHRKNSQKLLQKLNLEIKKLKTFQQEIEDNLNQFTQSITPMQHIELIRNVEKLGTFNRANK